MNIIVFQTYFQGVISGRMNALELRLVAATTQMQVTATQFRHHCPFGP